MWLLEIFSSGSVGTDRYQTEIYLSFTGRLFRNSVTSWSHPQQPYEPCTRTGSKASLPAVWSTRICMSQIPGAV